MFHFSFLNLQSKKNKEIWYLKVLKVDETKTLIEMQTACEQESILVGCVPPAFLVREMVSVGRPPGQRPHSAERFPPGQTPWKEHGIRDRYPHGRNMGAGSQTRSDIIQRPLLWTEWQTHVKTLPVPCPKLCLRVVKTANGKWPNSAGARWNRWFYHRCAFILFSFFLEIFNPFCGAVGIKTSARCSKTRKDLTRTNFSLTPKLKLQYVHCSCTTHPRLLRKSSFQFFTVLDFRPILIKLWILVLFQNDMNLSDEKKAPLQKRTLEQKRIMLAMQYKGSIQVSTHTYTHAPQHAGHAIQGHHPGEHAYIHTRTTHSMLAMQYKGSI